MEFASLQDAFPMGQGQDESQRKKKSKRSKEAFQAYEIPPTDADRPAVIRPQEVQPMRSSEENSYLDESTIFQEKPTVNNSLPMPRSTIQLQKAITAPSFFGAEPFANPNDDMMAPFNNGTKPNSYMLDSDFTKAFDQTGFGRVTSDALPVPELRNRWKPLSADSAETAFITKPKSNQFVGLDPSEFAAMKGKIDTLIARLDDIENRADGANPQMEMLSFIMTGLFLMFALDLAVRKSGSMRLVNVR